MEKLKELEEEVLIDVVEEKVFGDVEREIIS